MSSLNKTKAKICTDLEIANYHLTNARSIMVALDKDALQIEIKEIEKLINEIHHLKKPFEPYKTNKLSEIL